MLPCPTYCAMNVWFVAFADQKTGKALPEVMEADRPEPMLSWKKSGSCCWDYKMVIREEDGPSWIGQRVGPTTHDAIDAPSGRIGTFHSLSAKRRANLFLCERGSPR